VSELRFRARVKVGAQAKVRSCFYWANKEARKVFAMVLRNGAHGPTNGAEEAGPRLIATRNETTLRRRRSKYADECRRFNT
jgi:hypothetical protein